MARKRRRSGRRQPAALARYWANRRRGKKRHRKNPAARRPAMGYMQSPARRRRRKMNPAHGRRHYRRNQGLPSTGFLMDAAYVTGGFFATRMAAGFVLPMIPMADTMPIVRILGKGATAWGLGFLGGKFLGARAGQLLLLGGLVETLSDAVRTYVSPFIPALADSPMGSYPALSSYPTLGDYSNPYSVGNTVSDYDEAL